MSLQNASSEVFRTLHSHGYSLSYQDLSRLLVGAKEYETVWELWKGSFEEEKEDVLPILDGAFYQCIRTQSINSQRLYFLLKHGAQDPSGDAITKVIKAKQLTQREILSVVVDIRIFHKPSLHARVRAVLAAIERGHADVVELLADIRPLTVLPTKPYFGQKYVSAVQIALKLPLPEEFKVLIRAMYVPNHSVG